MSSKKQQDQDDEEEKIPPEFAEVFDKGASKATKARVAFHAKKAERAERAQFKPKDMGEDIITLMVKWVDSRKARPDFDRASAALLYVKQHLPRAWKQAFLTPME